jgi:predicted nuclease of predicted toxin-antitoxin system
MTTFLIDECLSPSLAAVANAAGFAAHHVNHLGLEGSKDWQLMKAILRGEYALVTNNRTDFLGLYRKQSLHSGLVIIVPNVPSALQEKLFRAALNHVGHRDLINTVVEVRMESDEAYCEEYPLPPA